uniref:Uncharacterized protein n=1 Tax=Caenorhabditis japonica TaxID=281687 RepID=A0A8R1EBD0_CAEJA
MPCLAHEPEFNSSTPWFYRPSPMALNNRKATSLNLSIGTTSEQSAQGKYPGPFECLRSPTSHREKEAWMGRQMEEANAKIDSQRLEATFWSVYNRQVPKGLVCCGQSSYFVIEARTD